MHLFVKEGCDKMSVFRIEKTKNYTVISNYHLRDKRLSLKAKGLLSYMLSLPEDWNYSLKGLCQVNKENETAIRSALKELEDNNYLERKKVRNNKGLFEYDYLIYEHPKKEPHIEYPYMENPCQENQIQINTNDINTNNKDKIDKSLCSITRELIKRKFIDINDIELYRYDSFFNELLEKYAYKKIIMVISYVINKLKNRSDIENKFGYFKIAVLNNLEKIQNKNIPEWFDKDLELNELSTDELEELNSILSEFS